MLARATLAGNQWSQKFLTIDSDDSRSLSGDHAQEVLRHSALNLSPTDQALPFPTSSLKSRATSCALSTSRNPSGETVVANQSSGRGAGPEITVPSGLKRLPWHGQSNSVSFHCTLHPRCVHIAEMTWNASFCRKTYSQCRELHAYPLRRSSGTAPP